MTCEICKKITFPRDAGCVQIAYFAFACCVAWNHCRFFIACIFLNVCFLKRCFKGGGIYSWRPRALTRAPYCTCRAEKKKNYCYFKRGDSGFCFWISVATIVTVRCLGLINGFWFMSARHALLLDITSVVFHFRDEIGICGALMSSIYQTASKNRVVFNCRALMFFLGSVISFGFILLQR